MAARSVRASIVLSTRPVRVSFFLASTRADVGRLDSRDGSPHDHHLLALSWS
jgi:hypothetical protein